jgi:broad specificity phosphatase PhoE
MRGEDRGHHDDDEDGEAIVSDPALLVLLVRHGHAESNARGRFANRTWDPPLTERGREEAEALAAQLRGTAIAGIVTSPLRRARETIGPLARDHRLTPVVLPGLAELDMGAWDGEVLRELAHRDPEAWRAWRADPDRHPPPQGERLSQVGARVLAGLDTLRGQDGLVVGATHADCIKGAIVTVIGAPAPASRRLQVPNGGQALLRAMDDGTWRLVLGPVCPTPGL